MSALDRNQPYGTISGDEFGRQYEQAGLFFIGDGSLWVEPAPVAPVVEVPAVPDISTIPVPKRGKAAAVEVIAPVDVPSAADEQLNAQMGV